MAFSWKQTVWAAVSTETAMLREEKTAVMKMLWTESFLFSTGGLPVIYLLSYFVAPVDTMLNYQPSLIDSAGTSPGAIIFYFQESWLVKTALSKSWKPHLPLPLYRI